MPDLENKFDALDNEVEELSSKLDSRIKSLEEQISAVASFFRFLFKDYEKETKDSSEPNKFLILLDYLIKVLGALTPIAVVVIGFMLTGSIEVALEERKVTIQERRLDLAGIQAMEHLLDNLQEQNVGKEKAQRIAFIIAGYGEHAITPLLMELDLEEAKKNRSSAAEKALQTFALTEERDLVCKRLQKVVEIKAPIFGANGHERVIRLLGTLQCIDARDALETYSKAINSADFPKKWLRDESIKEGMIEDISEALKVTLNQLKQEEK